MLSHYKFITHEVRVVNGLALIGGIGVYSNIRYSVLHHSQQFTMADHESLFITLPGRFTTIRPLEIDKTKCDLALWKAVRSGDIVTPKKFKRFYTAKTRVMPMYTLSTLQSDPNMISLYYKLTSPNSIGSLTLPPFHQKKSLSRKIST